MVRGSCLCGGIRFEAAKLPVIGFCHCSNCRKANGSAFDSGGALPAEDFSFTAGEDLIQTYESSPGFHRSFCRICGSRAPGRSPDGKHYYVPAGLLDDDPGVRGAFHMFVGSKAPWFEISDELPRFEGWVPGYGPDSDS